MTDENKKLSALMVMGLLAGIVIGIILGYIFFKGYIEEYTNTCYDTLENCGGLLETCWIENHGVNNPAPLNWTRVNDLVNSR